MQAQRKLMSCLLLLLMVSAVPLGAATAQTADVPKQQVLAYLKSLEGKHIIPGQFGFFGDAETPITATAGLDQIRAESGKDIALTGADYAARSADRADTNAWLIAQWRTLASCRIETRARVTASRAASSRRLSAHRRARRIRP